MYYAMVRKKAQVGYPGGSPPIFPVGETVDCVKNIVFFSTMLYPLLFELVYSVRRLGYLLLQWSCFMLFFPLWCLNSKSFFSDETSVCQVQEESVVWLSNAR